VSTIGLAVSTPRTGKAVESSHGFGRYESTHYWFLIDEADMVMSWSRYTELSRAEWARLRADTSLTLTPEDLLRRQGLNERVAMDEVVEVYLPLSRLLNLHVAPSKSSTRPGPRSLATSPPRCRT